MKRLAAALIALCTVSAASAADLCRGVNLDVHLGSWHTAPGYNNDNYGLGATCLRDGYGVSVGAYHNSFGYTSGYATIGKDFADVGPVRFGAVGGVLVGGYNIPIKPVAGLTVATDAAGVTWSMVVGPTIEKRGALFHFMVSRSI